jgi:hypothetical protein
MMPAKMSLARLNPVRRAIVPSSQPNMAPTSRLMKKMISPEKYMSPASFSGASSRFGVTNMRQAE